MKPIKKMPGWAFPAIERPSFTDTLKFPENLASISSGELGVAHGRFTSMLAYAASELAKLTVEKLKVESAISMEYHRRVVSLSMQDVQKWKIQNVVESSTAMVLLKKQLLEENIKIEAVRTYKENYERYAAALSREMSRRASEQRVQ